MKTLVRAESRASRWWQYTAAVIVVLAMAAAGLLLALPARAQLQPLACLLPNLGLHACDASSLVAAAPVSVSHDGATLTAAALLSSEGKTSLRLDFLHLARPAAQLPLGRLPVTLQDATGKSYSPADGWATWVKPNDLRSVSATASFAALDPAVRSVTIQVDAPAPIGRWSVRLPVKPVDASKLPKEMPGGKAVTVHGINVRIAGVVATPNGTLLQLVAKSLVAGQGLTNLANHHALTHPLILRDGKGRNYQETLRPRELLPQSGSGFTDEVAFPPLAPGAHSLSVSLQFVTAVEETTPVVIRVPVAGKWAGDHIPLDMTLKLGPYPLRVVGADIVTQPLDALAQQYGHLWLSLQMDYGDWAAGRKLVGPGVIEPVPVLQGAPVGEVSQFTRVSVPLSQASNGVLSVTFQNARVAIEGPWQLHAPLLRSP